MTCKSAAALSIGFSVFTALAGDAPPAAAPASADAGGGKAPLVLFVGDSITAGRPTGNSEYKPSEPVASPRFVAGSYGYVEALWEATRGRDIQYRFDKLGNGGQAITGWIGTTCRQVLEKRNGAIKESPAILVIQDFITVGFKEGNETKGADITNAIFRVIGSAGKSPETRVVLSTVTIEPGGTWSANVSPESVTAANDAVLKAAGETKTPVIRLDIAWERYLQFVKDRSPARNWRLTDHGSYYDGVHPGKMGAFFQALVFARELGIPAAMFDETAPALGLDKAQAAEIKTFVYSWTEPTVIPFPRVETADPVPR